MMEIYFLSNQYVSLFNKLLTSKSRDDDKCLYQSINLKVMIELSKLWIEKVKNVSMLLEIQLIFELEHFSAKYAIISLKSNFAPLWNNTVILLFFPLHSPCLNP